MDLHVSYWNVNYFWALLCLDVCRCLPVRLPSFLQAQIFNQRLVRIPYTYRIWFISIKPENKRQHGEIIGELYVNIRLDTKETCRYFFCQFIRMTDFGRIFGWMKLNFATNMHRKLTENIHFIKMKDYSAFSDIRICSTLKWPRSCFKEAIINSVWLNNEQISSN